MPAQIEQFEKSPLLPPQTASPMWLWISVSAAARRHPGRFLEDLGSAGEQNNRAAPDRRRLGKRW